MSENDPPSTVPSHVQLSMRGLGGADEWLQKFQASIIDITLTCGRFMDLRLLDGITVGADYEDALDSVDIGYESSVAKGYTKSGGLVGVAKTLRVKRDGEVRAHVVLNANVLTSLSDSDHEHFWPTANLVAHELAHVAIIGWFETHTPNVFLQPYQGDWATASLRDVAHTLWEEYAACRLSAMFGTEHVQAQYAESVDVSIGSTFQDAQNCIKQYRLHGDASRLLVEVTRHIATPLKMCAYLLGHLDGAKSTAKIADLCPELKASEYAEFIAPLRESFRKAWETRHDWEGLHGVDGIMSAVIPALAKAGIIVNLSDEPPGTRIDAPYTAETLPNGEADMKLIEQQRLLRSIFGS